MIEGTLVMEACRAMRQSVLLGPETCPGCGTLHAQVILKPVPPSRSRRPVGNCGLLRQAKAEPAIRLYVPLEAANREYRAWDVFTCSHRPVELSYLKLDDERRHRGIECHRGQTPCAVRERGAYLEPGRRLGES
ncbi:MAG: hypothetical protein V3T34_08440 [Methylobacterium ajmalii]|nr:hypothetical protein [Methylobacterium sp.]